MTFDPHFDNRSEEGLQLNVDGHGVEWDREESLESYNSTYTTSEAIEVEPQLPSEQ
jgi:hypothetical protein